jgi:iron complex outermembrane receptor protein
LENRRFTKLRLRQTARGFAAFGCLGAVCATPVAAQQPTGVLAPISVTSSRLGDGITGASTTVVTAEEIAHAPQSTLSDILSKYAGVQTSSFYGGVNGVGTTVDLRGFGVTGPSNTLVLVNGRRLNDWDLPGVDLSSIDRNSIERIEITRGNSGAVLYGDGAVGGVINIVTKNGVGKAPSARVEAGFGSFNTKEGNVSANASSGPLSASINASAIQSDGWRINNKLSQKAGIGDFRYQTDQGSAFFTVSTDDQKVRLPGPRNVTEMLLDPRGTGTPFNYSEKTGFSVTTGATRMLTDGVELIVDGGVRQKDQIGGFFAFGSGNYIVSDLTTASLTPRLKIDRTFFGMPMHILTGIDLYNTDYQSKRSQFQGQRPIHIYDLEQRTMAAYWQQTVTVLPTTDISFGGRIQRNHVAATDVYDPLAPQGFSNPQGLPLDTTETNRAFHLGFEHRFNDVFAVFGRHAQSFRLPNLDERVGASPIFTVTNFALKTQKSHDLEAGVKFNAGPLYIQSSVFDMRLTNELHLSPITFANENFDPTRRRGWETSTRFRVAENVTLNGSLTLLRARFREGPFANKNVPVVSRATGSAGVTWGIIDKRLVFDGTVRYVGQRYLDSDEANAGVYKIPAHALVDVKLSGEIDRYFYSFSVQNLLDRTYFNYGLDEGFGFYQFYPQPGRTFMAKAGVTF